MILMPLYGATGAAIAFLLSYVTLAAVAGYFAHHHYPMTYEKGRIARLVAAAAVSAAVALAIPPLPPLAGFLTRGSTTVVVFGALLWMAGFMRPTERAFLAGFLARKAHAGR